MRSGDWISASTPASACTTALTTRRGRPAAQLNPMLSPGERQDVAIYCSNDQLEPQMCCSYTSQAGSETGFKSLTNISLDQVFLLQKGNLCTDAGQLLSA